jgi:hypothetical protein
MTFSVGKGFSGGVAYLALIRCCDVIGVGAAVLVRIGGWLFRSNKIPCRIPTPCRSVGPSSSALAYRRRFLGSKGGKTGGFEYKKGIVVIIDIYVLP